MKKVLLFVILTVGLLFSFNGNSQAQATKADSALNTAVDVITTIAPAIEVDTINNLQDAVAPTTDLIETLPTKGSSWQSILAWITGAIGLILGLVFYFIKKKKAKTAAADAAKK
jgi:heme/copper-type cytochrome/quinol oxidase subunit 2